MADEANEKAHRAERAASGKRGGRPSHWEHPVDERRRLARARRHRRWRIAAVVVAVVLASLVGTYLYLTSDERVEQFAETYLENLFGTHVSIKRASFSLLEGALVLEGIAIHAPEPFREPILSASQVDLRIDPPALARLRLDVTEIVVHRPTINLVLWDEKVWNFQKLMRSCPPQRVVPPIRPVVALEKGTLRIKRKVAAETVYEHEMAVSGLVLPSETRDRTFRFQTDVTSEQVHLAVTSGLADARTGALELEGQASNVVLSPDLYRALPAEVQRVWDRFEPTGSVNLKVLFDDKEGFRLATELTGVSFAYAYRGFTHRFENLTGRAVFSRTAVVLEGVEGLLNGSPIRLAGRVSGFDRKHLALDLSASSSNVDLEEGRTVLLGVAPHLAALYEQYKPKGRVDVDLVVRRAAGEEKPLEVSGALLCRDVEVTYFRFPYRFERLRGTVRFPPEEFATDGLAGFHGASPVRLEGYAKNPGPRVDARVTVTAQNVPLDDELRAALGPARRAIFDQYSPSGAADLKVEVRRLPKEGARLDVVVWANLLGCNVRYEGFPYGITDATGPVVIRRGRTEIQGVRGRHGKAEITLSGEVASRPKGPAQFDLEVSGRDVLLDEDLEAALPERERKTLRAFHLSGRADIEGRVRRGPETEGRLDYSLVIGLKGARMIYEVFPFLVENVTGRLHLTPESCRIDSLVGTNSGARLEARGWVEQRADDYALDVEIRGTDVQLDEQLRAALGPQVRSAWSHLAPSGRADVKAHLTKAPGRDERLNHHVWVTARKAQVRLSLFPFPLVDVSGELEFEGSDVRLHAVRARNGPTWFFINGTIVYGESGPETDLSIEARDLHLEGPIRRALPEALARVFEALTPTGRVDLKLKRLLYRGTGPETSKAQWSGTALLDELGLDVGVKISDVVGTAEMEGWSSGGQLALSGTLWIQQGRIADKEVTDTKLVFEKEASSEELAVRSIEGMFYGGRIEGTATVSLKPGGRYGFRLEAVDVDFERLLREGFRLEHNITGGRVRGNLALRASGPDAGDVEASGYAHVTDAHLYELPLIVRILNLLRLAPADRTAFREARIWYFARGKRIILDDIRLEGRAVNLYGAGTVEPGGRLNLTFMTGKKDDDPLVPALAELVEGLRQELVLVEVTGTLAEPQVRLRSFKRLSAPLRELVALIRESRERRNR